jgi:hypothetical protein
MQARKLPCVYIGFYKGISPCTLASHAAVKALFAPAPAADAADGETESKWAWKIVQFDVTTAYLQSSYQIEVPYNLEAVS